MSDPAPLVVVPVNENIPRADKAPASEHSAAVPLPPRRHRSWFAALCALVALIGAAGALAAPGLRPRIADAADRWFGSPNIVSELLAPSPAIEAGWRQARQEAMQAVSAQFGEVTTRLDRLTAAQQVTAADLARGLADLRAARAANETLTRAVDAQARQADELRATAAAIDARGRAAGLLALSMRLRRDLDAGLPLDRDVAALSAGGPYPPPVERALLQLRGASDGAPTMRDLADEFDRLLAQIAGRSGVGTSWMSAGFSRIAAMFGGGASLENARLIEHLRALAADGRFSEAATELEASDAADIGANWAARVHARANAVLATQALLAYSIAAYENAFAATEAK